MRIIRAKGTTVVEFLEPYLLQDDDYAEVSVGDVLREMLSGQAERTCVYLAYKEDPNKPDEIEVCAFIIAFAPANITHVWLFQVWCDPKYANKGLADKMFLRVILWAEHIGRSFIRGETKRNEGAVYRKWGFREHSKIVQYELVPEQAINALSKQTSHRDLVGGDDGEEHDHGRRRKTRNDEDADAESEAGGQGTERSAGGEGGKGSSPVLGGTDSEGDSSVRHGDEDDAGLLSDRSEGEPSSPEGST